MDEEMTNEEIALYKAELNDHILAVLPCLPFGGLAKIAFEFIERAIKGM